jgi:spore germination protein GerM
MALSAGCGLPVNSSPQAIPLGQVPSALNVTKPNASGLSRAHGTVAVPVYFIASTGDSLTKAHRYLHPRITAQKVLDALAAGPSLKEFDEGIQSAIPTRSNLVATGVNDGVLTIGLDSSFESVPAGQTTYYFAQIVYSITSITGITGVRFEYDGALIPAEVGNGSIGTDYVVHRDDYKQLTP